MSGTILGDVPNILLGDDTDDTKVRRFWFKIQGQQRRGVSVEWDVGIEDIVPCGDEGVKFCQGGGERRPPPVRATPPRLHLVQWSPPPPGVLHDTGRGGCPLCSPSSCGA